MPDLFICLTFNNLQSFVWSFYIHYSICLCKKQKVYALKLWFNILISYQSVGIYQLGSFKYFIIFHGCDLVMFYPRIIAQKRSFYAMGKKIMKVFWQTKVLKKKKSYLQCMERFIKMLILILHIFRTNTTCYCFFFFECKQACGAGCRHRPFPMQLYQYAKFTPSVKWP